MDDVLINSASNIRYALLQTAKSMQIKLSFESYRKYLGLPFEKILKNMGIKKDISKKKINKIKINKKFIKQLYKLKKDYFLAVFTSKNRSRTKIIWSEKKLFDCIITADDVSSGKPNPKVLKKYLNC